MPPAQRVGQLFMTAVSATGATRTETGVLRRHHVGSVFLRGRSGAGVRRTRGLVDRIRAVASSAGSARVRPFVAADQEGGQVQTLSGPGFSAIPAAITQGQWSAPVLESDAAVWGRQLRAAGVDLDLAPVADVVPRSLGTANEPIGRYGREYGHEPGPAAAGSTAFMRGLARGGVLSTLKHFPGLGHVRRNTDTSAGVTDRVTSGASAGLYPFRAGITAGAPAVMVSSAVYTRIDPAHRAVFSPAVIRRLLRGTLGFRGLVVSDDLGSAVSVRAVPEGERAVAFLRSGGDLVLTVDPATVGPMTAAVLGRLRSDPSFRSRVDESVRRVLTLKKAAGLLDCGG